MNKFILISAFVGFIGLVVANVLTDHKGATRALALQGITNIQIAGYAISECGFSGIWRTKFSGTDINGKPTSGAVCLGLDKSEIIYDLAR